MFALPSLLPFPIRPDRAAGQLRAIPPCSASVARLHPGLALLLAAWVVIVATPPAFATVRLPVKLFSNSMVVQRDLPVPVWGWADPGENVSVEFAGQTHTTTAGGDGAWRVRLDPLPAGGPHVLVVRGASNTININDVLVGEVFIFAGQSNMQWSLGGAGAEGAEAIAAADQFPHIRLLNCERNHTDVPQAELGRLATAWQVGTTARAPNFSAVAYFTLKNLHQTLGVPVGGLVIAQGSTDIQAFISWDALMRDPETAAAAVAMTEEPWDQRDASTFYNGCVHPLAPYAVRGAIFYQGESDSESEEIVLYRKNQALLVEDWRALWGQETFAFGITMICPRSNSQTQWIQEAQYDAWTGLAEAGIVSTLDNPDVDDIHPPTKKYIGDRFAGWVRERVLRVDAGRFTPGPVWSGFSVQGNQVVITFAQVGSGLVVPGGGTVLDPANWTVAGADQTFVDAQSVTLVGRDTVVVTSSVANPVAVTYAFDRTPRATPDLYNAEGYCAYPFRTDRWRRGWFKPAGEYLTLAAPFEGQRFTQGAPILVSVPATAGITAVTLAWEGGATVATDGAFPFQFTLADVPVGEHAIAVRGEGPGGPYTDRVTFVVVPLEVGLAANPAGAPALPWTVYWPADLTDAVLQGRASLQDPWTTVTSGIVRSGLHLAYPFSLDTGARYFRLVR